MIAIARDYGRVVIPDDVATKKAHYVKLIGISRGFKKSYYRWRAVTGLVLFLTGCLWSWVYFSERFGPILFLSVLALGLVEWLWLDSKTMSYYAKWQQYEGQAASYRARYNQYFFDKE